MSCMVPVQWGPSLISLNMSGAVVPCAVGTKGSFILHETETTPRTGKQWVSILCYVLCTLHSDREPLFSIVPILVRVHEEMYVRTTERHDWKHYLPATSLQIRKKLFLLISLFKNPNPKDVVECHSWGFRFSYLRLVLSPQRRCDCFFLLDIGLITVRIRSLREGGAPMWPLPFMPVASHLFTWGHVCL